MLPFIKLFSLVVKVFSKPLINYTRKIHSTRKGEHSGGIRSFFLFLGNRYHKFETYVNRKFLNLSSGDEFFVKPLNDEVAIDKGIEFFYELIFYLIIIALPIYEMNKSHTESAEKSKKLNDRIGNIENQIVEVSKNYKEKVKRIEEENEACKSKLLEYEGKVIELEKEIEKAYIMNKFNVSKTDAEIQTQRDGDSGYIDSAFSFKPEKEI